MKYITGRERKPGQINGKSENLNNALQNHIFSKDSLSTVSLSLTSAELAALQTQGSPPSDQTQDKAKFDWFQALPAKEVIVVFDADMRAKPDFFLKTLEVMADEDCQLCLTPQAFHNIDADADLFNNLNKQFWEVSSSSTCTCNLTPTQECKIA